MSLRTLMVGVLLVGALIGQTAASPVQAADPILYHIIESYHADANVSVLDSEGCRLTDIWVSSSWARYLPQPPGGRPVPQGLTRLDIFVYDLCGSAVPSVMAGGGGGGALVAQWFAEVREPLVVRRNLSAAWFSSTLEVVDEESGDHATAIVDLAWLPAGPIDHYTVNLGEHWPHYGMVRGNTNAWIRDATVTGSITLDGDELLGGAVGTGHLERTKWNCIENTHPHAPGAVGFCVLH
jgi:hypothetical protein